MQAQYDVFSNDLPMPELPARRSYQPPTPGPAPPSGAPNPPEAVLASQPPPQRQRLEADLQAAREMEAQQAKVRWAAAPTECLVDLLSWAGAMTYPTRRRWRSHVGLCATSARVARYGFWGFPPPCQEALVAMALVAPLHPCFMSVACTRVT